jgi:hypothetical protein
MHGTNMLFSDVKCQKQIEFRWCEGYYLVIEVGNISRALHVIPNFKTLDRFFINAYKF